MDFRLFEPGRRLQTFNLARPKAVIASRDESLSNSLLSDVAPKSPVSSVVRRYYILLLQLKAGPNSLR